MDAFIKEATEHKPEKQELLNEMGTKKIGEFDDQLRLSKKNLHTYVSPQAEADNIEDIPPNVASNAVNNLEEIDVEQELGTAVLLRSIMESLNFMWIHQLKHYQNLVPGITKIQTSWNFKRPFH